MKMISLSRLVALAFLSLPLCGQAQRDSASADSIAWRTDLTGSSEDCWAMKEGFVLWPGMEVPAMGNDAWPCMMQPAEKTVPADSVFIALPVSGMDCHSQFDYRWRFNPEAMQVEYEVVVTYKGCRAGGNHFIRFARLPMPRGWHLKITYWNVDPTDSLHGITSHDFFYHSPRR